MKKRFLLFISLLLLAFSCAQPGTDPEGGVDTSNLSGVAELSDLKLSDNLRLNQHFSPGHYRYRLTVVRDQTALTVTPTLKDNKASYSFTNNGAAVSNPIPLTVGMNSININVTAENGKATRIYRLFVTRQGETNADLTGISGVTLKEQFESHVTSYTAYVDLSVESLTITPQLSDPQAGCLVNNASPETAVNLNTGDNLITIKVIAEDGKTEKLYFVTITRWDKTDATLKGINGITLKEPITAGRLNYSATTVDSDQTDIIPIMTNKFASYSFKVNGVEATGPLKLNHGHNAVDIIVTSQDKSKTQTYKLDLIREVIIDDFETRDLSRNPWKYDKNYYIGVNHRPSYGYEVLLGATTEQWYENLELAIEVVEEAELKFDYSYKTGYSSTDFQFFLNEELKLSGVETTRNSASYRLKPGIYCLKWVVYHYDNKLYLDNIISVGGKVKSVNFPPTNLAASTTSTATYATLSWSSVEGAQSYNIYRATTATGIYEKVNTESIFKSSFTDHTLHQNSSYFYKVTAIIGGQESFKSEYIEYKTGARPPVPSGLKVLPNSVTDRVVALEWNRLSNVTGYKVYRALSIDGIYSQSGTVERSDRTDWKDWSLTPGTLYYYKISSYKNGDESLLSSPITVQAALGVPQNIKATSTEDTITLQWDSSAVSPFYQVYRSSAIDGPYTLLSPANYSLTTFTDTGLTGVTAYYYKLKSIKGALESALSPPIQVTTKMPTPANLRVTAKRLTAISLSWDSVQEATKYELLRADSADGIYTSLSSSIVGTSYIDASLERERTYYYKVRALNDAQFSSQDSAYLEANTNENKDIGIPRGLTVIANDSRSFDISWNPVSGATGYVLYYSVDSRQGPYYVHNKYTSTSHTIYGHGYQITSGKTYYYIVTALNANGEGGASLYDSATAVSPPSAPTGVSIQSSSSTRITVSWSSSYGATRYEILRATSASGSYSSVGYSSGTTYTHNGTFSPGSIYYYKVRAIRGSDRSELSSYASTVISGSATLKNFRATSITSTSVNLSWSSFSGASQYKLYRSTSVNGYFSPLGSFFGTSAYNGTLSANTAYVYKLVACDNRGNPLGSPAYLNVRTK